MFSLITFLHIRDPPPFSPGSCEQDRVIMSPRIITNASFLQSATMSGGSVNASSPTHPEVRNNRLIEKLT